MKQKRPGSNLFATASIRAREGRLLSGETVRQVLTADERLSPEEILRGTLFGDYIERHGATDPAALIPHVRDDVFIFLRRHVTPPGAVRFLLLPYDYHNLKVLLKGKMLNLPAEDLLLPMGSINSEKMKDIFRREEFSLLPERMAFCLNEAVAAWTELEDPRLLDTIPDRQMMLHLLDEAEKMESPFIVGYCRLLIDCGNCRILSRGEGIERKILEEHVLVPGGAILLEELLDESPEPVLARHGYQSIAAAFAEEEKAFAVEGACTRELRRYLNDAQYFIGGIEPSMAFALTVEEDLRVLWSLMQARAAGMDEDKARRRIPGI